MRRLKWAETGYGKAWYYTIDGDIVSKLDSTEILGEILRILKRRNIHKLKGGEK